MPRPGVGNPGNRGGKKGVSGRKSQYQERADAIMLEKMFMDEMAKEDIQKKLASGKYSIKDVFVSKAFAGNEKFITAMFNKLFPDKTDITTGGRRLIAPIDDDDLKKLLSLYDNQRKNKVDDKPDSGGEGSDSKE